MQRSIALLAGLALVAAGQSTSASPTSGSAASSSASPRSVPLHLDGGFWFGSFDVGESKNLSLLIDTGSSDLIVNPGLYKPSSKSVNLNRSTELEYGTAQSNGCGFADIKAAEYTDQVSVAGYTVKNQTFGTVIKTPPPDNSTITQFPGQGIVGLMGVTRSDTVTGGVPFFQHLCNRNIVPECRFGLALGTNGKGKQVVGGFDSSLFHGTPVTTPLYHRFEWVIDGGLDPALGVKQTQLQQHILLDVGTSNVGASSSRTQLDR